MQQFNNILFLSQGVMDNRESLAQSIRLAWRNKAKLKGLVVCPHLPNDMNDYEDQYETWLMESMQSLVQESLVEQDMSREDLQFPVELIVADKPTVQAIRYVQDHAIDLVIKDAEPNQSRSRGLRAIDMSLLRKCPCPVWLNRPSDKPRNKQRVAVAVNPNATTDEEKTLSIQLLQLGRSIADSCDSRLHIISCWEYVLEHYLDDHIWIKVSQDELQQQIELAKQQHYEALQTLIEASDIGGDLVMHRLHGTPDAEIPHCVEETDIDVLVMGTLARTGIPGVVIGNTAENIVQSVNCSLVALKSKQFRSPIK